MADNFNLRTFLTENKLTKNTQILKEGSDYGFDEVMDAIADDFTPGTPEFQQMEDAVQDAFHNGQVDTSEFSHDPSAPGREMRAIANQIGLGDEQANDIEQAQHDIERQFEEGVNESTLTDKERRLVEMVQDALGEENVDYTMGRQDDPNQLPNPAPELNIPEGEESIEEAKPLPKYNSIEELMKEIENGTNEAAHKYKMDEMKRVYEALEAKVGSLEEGEHAEHIDQKAVKQMRKDIAALRKAEEKLRKEFDKKFTGKEKKETPKKDKEVVALQEGTFDLRKFLVENKLTAGSRMVNENADTYDTDYTSAEQAVKGGKLLSSFNSPKTGINPTAMRQHIAQPQEEKYIFWYDEPGELTGTKEVTAREALQIVKAMNGEGRVPAGVPSGIAGELHSVPVRMVK
jgi:hypothetical protein